MTQSMNTKKDTNSFSNIKDKTNCNLDIEECYPSISKELFTDSLGFATVSTDLSEEEKSIIMNAKKL